MRRRLLNALSCRQEERGVLRRLFAGLLVSVFQGAGGEQSLGQQLGQQLCRSVHKKNHDESGRLMEHGADPNVVCKRKSRGMPLHVAAKNGDWVAVQALLKHGADLKARNRWGRTALHVAARKGHLAVAEVLVDSNADLLAVDLGMETPAELAKNHNHSRVKELLIRSGGAEPTPTSWRSWVHVLRFHPQEVAACAGVGVLLAGFKTAVEWAYPRGVSTATQDPSPALAPSMGALRLAAKAMAPCGPLVLPVKLLTNSLGVIASLLTVCGPCMWSAKPLYVAMVAGPAFLAPALWTFGWRETVNFPVLVLATKTPAAKCRAAITSLLLAIVGYFVLFGDPPDYLCSAALLECRRQECSLDHHSTSFSFSLGGFAVRGGLAVESMTHVYVLFFLFLDLATLVWVLGMALTTPRCCGLPVASRAAVEELAREIDGANTAGELILMDLNTIATFVVTCNFWFAGVLWTAFLAALSSELAKGNIQALPKELRRTLATGVMTDRLIEFLDTDKGFEAPFSLAITIYAMPYVARDANTFLVQCFSLLTSTLGIASFLTNYLTLATLADQPELRGSGAVSSEGYSAMPTARASGQEEPELRESGAMSSEAYVALPTAMASGHEELASV